MKRTVLVIVLGVIAFGAIVLARLPASWVLPAASADLRCASVAGSLWSGYCSGLTVRGTALGDLAWQVRPLRLFRGELAAHIDLERAPAIFARGNVAMGLGGTLLVHDLTASLPLSTQVIAALPAGLTGSLHLDLTRARITRQGVVRSLKGRIEARDIIDSSGAVTPLGSFAVTFPGGAGEPTGAVRDLGGPLSVQGSIVLTPQPGYDLSGYVTPRPSAVPALINAIEFLGTPDAQGRRRFALSGSY
jgi:general secretion pathway protein N